MGMYDTVILDDSIVLPEFPDDGRTSELDWQTKDIGYPSMRTFKITGDGRLLRKEVEKEEMTQKEMDEYARENGYSSWRDWEKSDTMLDEPLETWKYKTSDEWWANHNMHGSFEFHCSTKNIDGYDDIYWSYEARFTKGELDEIIFLGERGTDGWKKG